MTVMEEKKVIISPKTKVGDLLDAYPGLEPVLMAMSPSFEKLKNPVLRKTVAKVATLQQVSVVGGLNIEEMIRSLRSAAGQSYDEQPAESSGYVSGESPGWLDRSKITARFDATPVINSGGSPMQEILRQAAALQTGEILELQTPFTPAPIIDMLRSKSFRTHTIVDNEKTFTYIIK
jgi:hypothetical protein